MVCGPVLQNIWLSCNRTLDALSHKTTENTGSCDWQNCVSRPGLLKALRCKEQFSPHQVRGTTHLSKSWCWVLSFIFYLTKPALCLLTRRGAPGHPAGLGLNPSNRVPFPLSNLHNVVRAESRPAEQTEPYRGSSDTGTRRDTTTQGVHLPLCPLVFGPVYLVSGPLSPTPKDISVTACRQVNCVRRC